MMKVYFDNTSNNVLIEGLNRYFGSGSLEAVIEDEKISIRNKNTTINELHLPYTSFTKEDGTSAGANITEVVNYLNTEFAKKNVTGTASFSLLSTTLTINNPNIKAGQLFGVVALGTVINEVVAVQSVSDGVLIVRRSVINAVTGLTNNLSVNYFRM